MPIKLLKILAWIIFFPFMLTYWGWKTKKKLVMIIGATFSALFIAFASIDTGTTGAGEELKTPELNQSEFVTDVIEASGEANNGTDLPEVEDTEDSQAEDDPDLTEESELVHASVESEESQMNNETSESSESDNLANSSSADGSDKEIAENSNEPSERKLFEGYRLIEADGGDLSGRRESNVVVDIGFGNREYYAFTNEFGQLVKVIADEIILQDEENELVLESGRYYPDEAKVPGTESPDLDEGHVIADSLGGVANAYNITPQNSTMNRFGDQAYMEDQIRKAGGCSNFVAIITYPDNETQIPNHYSFEYILEGRVVRDEFDNVNPDKANEALVESEQNEDIEDSSEVINPATIDSTGDSDDSYDIRIKDLDKVAEYIIIENTGSSDMNLSGWKIVSELGPQTYEFSDFILKANSQVMLGGYKSIDIVDLVWQEGQGIWNNKKSDPAALYDNMGTLISRLEN